MKIDIYKTRIAILAICGSLIPFSSALADELYYNSITGSGAVGVLDSTGNHKTIKSYSPSFFSTGWTNVVNTLNGIFYHNSVNGAAAVGVLDAAGNHKTIKSYSPGFFSTGWTQIIDTFSPRL